MIKLWRPVGSHSFVNSHDITIYNIRIKMRFRCKVGRDEETDVFDRDGMMFKVSILLRRSHIKEVNDSMNICFPYIFMSQ